MTVEWVDLYFPALLKFRVLSGNYANVVFSDFYIPALKEELVRLNRECLITDKLFNVSLANIQALLGASEVNGYLVGLKKVLSESNDQESVADLAKELRGSVGHIKSEFAKVLDGLSFQINGLATLKISENDLEYMSLEKRRRDLIEKLPEDKEALTRLKDKRDELVRAILEFESKTFLDKMSPIAQILKDNLETVLDDGGGLISKSGGKAVMTPMASKTAIKTGMEVAGAVLNIVNEQIKYEQLLIARDRLGAEINIRQTQMSVQEKEIDEIDEKRAQLSALREIVEPRRNYVTEARKVLAMLVAYFDEVLSQDVGELNDLIGCVEKFVESSPKLLRHINKLQFYWLRAE